MARVTYQMDQPGTAPLLRNPAMRRAVARRAEKGAAAARRETEHRDRVKVHAQDRGNGQWSDRAAADVEAPHGALNTVVDAVERG